MTSGGNKIRMSVSAYDRTAGLVIALNILVGFAVTLLFLFWLSKVIRFAPEEQATVVLVENIAGRGDHAAGFARDAVQAALQDPQAMARVLGEYLTEPKASVWFDAGHAPRTLRGVVLDRRTRMMHDARHIFINGESYRAAGRDATLMRTLADRRMLSDAQVAAASDDARSLLRDWCESGWLHAATGAGAKA